MAFMIHGGDHVRVNVKANVIVLPLPPVPRGKPERRTQQLDIVARGGEECTDT